MMIESIGRVRAFSSLVKLSHTVFALPFAAAAVVLATARPHMPLTAARALAMLVAMVAARTAAMAYNRYLDRDIDGRNPRTKDREVPSGSCLRRRALGLTVASSLVFVAAAATLGTWPRLLALPVLAVLLGYSWTKRFTWASHLVLGLSLALAPGGAWIAMGAAPEPAIVALMLAVITWVGGFDVLYSLQDEALRSRPRAPLDSRAFRHRRRRRHLGGAARGHGDLPRAFGHLARSAAPRSSPASRWWRALLVYEHALVGRGNLEKSTAHSSTSTAT